MTQEVRVPDIGNFSDVAVIEVLVKAQDVIKAEQPLISVETDKATMEIPSPVDGVVQEVLLKVGDKVSKDSVILVLATNAAAPTKVQPATAQATAPQSTPVPSPATKATPITAAPSVEPAIEKATSDTHAGPAVRRFAKELGVELNNINGSGHKGRVVLQDVKEYVKNNLGQGGGSFNLPAAPKIDFSQWGEIQVVALPRIKKLSGQYLHKNWLNIPHVTQFEQVDITDLEEFRQEMQAEASKHGVKLTTLGFIIKALVAALQKFPNFNASLDSDLQNLIVKNYYHIGVAVDTKQGLVVPVIRDVAQKGLLVLAQDLTTVSEKARNGQLKAADMQGGTFTISSLGGIGGTYFTPIINAPEVAILGVSKAVISAQYRDGSFVPRLMLPLSLSYDHRVIDGAEACRFITYLSSVLNDLRRSLL